MSTTQPSPADRMAAPHRRPIRPRSQRGNALLWFMLASVLVGLIAVAAYDMYQSGARNTDIQGVTNEITGVIGETKSSFGQYGFSGLTTAISVGSRLIPRSRADSAGTGGINQFGGAITLVDNNANVAQTALLTYAGVPQDLCAKVVTMTERLARGVTVAGTSVKATTSGATLNVATLNTQCTSADPVSIGWIIGRV